MVLLLLVLSVVLGFWARWLGRRRVGVHAAVRYVPRVIVVVFVAVGGVTAWGLLNAFTAVSDAGASEKATLLAEGIATALNATAAGFVILVPILILLVVATFRSSPKPSDEEN